MVGHDSRPRSLLEIVDLRQSSSCDVKEVGGPREATFLCSWIGEEEGVLGPRLLANCRYEMRISQGAPVGYSVAQPAPNKSNEPQSVLSVGNDGD